MREDDNTDLDVLATHDAGDASETVDGSPLMDVVITGQRNPKLLPRIIKAVGVSVAMSIGLPAFVHYAIAIFAFPGFAQSVWWTLCLAAFALLGLALGVHYFRHGIARIVFREHDLLLSNWLRRQSVLYEHVRLVKVAFKKTSYGERPRLTMKLKPGLDFEMPLDVNEWSEQFEEIRAMCPHAPGLGSYDEHYDPIDPTYVADVQQDLAVEMRRSARTHIKLGFISIFATIGVTYFTVRAWAYMLNQPAMLAFLVLGPVGACTSLLRAASLRRKARDIESRSAMNAGHIDNECDGPLDADDD
jgi:hypothetical protein